jgi:dipeptidyl-peptidase-4
VAVLGGNLRAPDIGYWWSPDSRSIAYLQTDDSRVPISTFVDFQPEEPRVIRQHYPKAGAPNPVVRTGIVDLAGSRVTRWVRIVDKPFDTLLRVKWLPDGKRLSVQTETRDQKELRLYLVDRATGTATRVMTEIGKGWINITTICTSSRTASTSSGRPNATATITSTATRSMGRW